MNDSPMYDDISDSPYSSVSKGSIPGTEFHVVKDFGALVQDNLPRKKKYVVMKK